jgi:hypothetical protein
MVLYVGLVCVWLVLGLLFGLIAGPCIAHGTRETWE